MKIIWEGNLERYGHRKYRLAIIETLGNHSIPEKFIEFYEKNIDRFDNEYWESGVDEKISQLILVTVLNQLPDIYTNPPFAGYTK